MNGFSFIQRDGKNTLVCGGDTVLTILPAADAKDSFEELEEGVFCWTRRTSAPVCEMRMEYDTAEAADYTMIPALNYNGNGWGDSVEYTGDNCDGTPWTYAWHRTTIPACTFSEEKKYSAALMCEADDTASCSLFLADTGKTRHSLIWPEQEGPKVLYRHEWYKGGAYMGSIEPRDTFCGIICAFRTERPRHQCRSLLDFAWRHYAHSIPAPKSPDDLWRYSIAFIKSLWTREKDGFCSFNRGLQWYKDSCFFAKRDAIKYEIGWVGQCASLSNTLLTEYLRTGDKDAFEKAKTVLKSWIDFSKLDNGTGLHRIKFDGAPCEQERIIPLDACNLGQGAYQFFLAYDLMKKCGEEHPEYIDFAMDICNFAVKTQKADGEFAKSWNEDGSVNQQNGTIGCFLIPALLEAYRRTGEKKYLDSSVRAFDRYYSELDKYGFTTAGALDTYCIDKESSSPLLSAALALHRATNDKKYITCAVEIAWYLSTWMMHYTVKHPESTVLGEIGYDSFGATAVSTAHNAIDQYALHDVGSFIELSELTGDKQWKQRALAFWIGGSQLVSDGTLCIAGRVRPAGSQDEAVFHTRWGRPGLEPYNPSQWLVAWPVAFRMEILREYAQKPDGWEIFRKGLEI